MSGSLIWALTRDHNAFLFKRGRTPRDQEIQLSSEPGNLMNVNTFKYSGLANAGTIDLAQGTSNKGKKVVVLSKKGKSTKSMTGKEVCKVYKVGALNKAIKGYRGDLASAAVAKYNRLAKGALVANKQSKGKMTARNRKGVVGDFTFSKLTSFRNHVRKAEEEEA